MRNNGKWMRRIVFWSTLCVVTAGGSFAGLLWLKNQPVPQSEPPSQSLAPPPPPNAGTTPQLNPPAVPPPSSPVAGAGPQPTPTPEPIQQPSPPPAVSTNPPASPAPPNSPAVPHRVLPWAETKGDLHDPLTGYPEEVIHKRSRIEMVLIKPGSYERGSQTVRSMREQDETPSHTVIISKPFYIGKYEVTQGQWQRFMEASRSRFNKGDDFPVERVGGGDIFTFLKKTELRLPTEAEWEYVCKAGKEEPLEGQANPMDVLMTLAWFSPYSSRSPQPVGKKHENGFGVYDTLGNVAEWTGSWYDNAEYARSVPSVTDPQGPQRGDQLVIRGCSAESRGDECRCANRFWGNPRTTTGYGFIGFRVARNVE